jgi:hypothetical protein
LGVVGDRVQEVVEIELPDDFLAELKGGRELSGALGDAGLQHIAGRSDFGAHHLEGASQATQFVIP